MSSLSTSTSQILRVPARESEIEERRSLHDAPLPTGDRNQNPSGIGLLALIAEDFRNHGRDLLAPGFWAVAVHRFGNARMGIRFKLLRAPFSVVYRMMSTSISWLWGIDLPYATKLGRRVRIGHHGGVWLGARSIGDDVHIRHNTTFGMSRDGCGLPIIGNRVEVGPGSCIVGAVTVGDDCVIGPNSVVIRDLPPGSVVMGVPARQTALWKDGASPNTPKPESPTSLEDNHGAHYRRLWLSVMLLLAATIGYVFAVTTGNERKSNVTTSQLAADMAEVRQGRILFSHHSVGANIIAGIKRLDADISGKGRLRLAPLEEAATSEEPALIDISGGQNGEPKTKIDFFAATIRGDTRLKPHLAFMKLCFVDFNPQTNVENLFGYYRSTLEALKREHPEIRFAHVTVPLTARPTGLKPWVFRLIGREVWEDMANVKRAEFNDLLKKSFGADPVFDLARLEATAPDGHLTTFEQGGHVYFSLYPGYTEDGGHLNTLGQQVVGAAAIKFMGEGLKGRNSAR